MSIENDIPWSAFPVLQKKTTTKLYIALQVKMLDQTITLVNTFTTDEYAVWHLREKSTALYPSGSWKKSTEDLLSLLRLTWVSECWAQFCQTKRFNSK